MMQLADVSTLRDARRAETAEELLDLEVDLLAGFVLARASAGMADTTIRTDVLYLEQIRRWLDRPLWTMRPQDADRLFGEALRDAAPNSRRGKATSLVLYFRFLELRHKVELFHRTGHAVECPLDELNRPAGGDMLVRVPPSAAEVQALFTGWRSELLTCRKYTTAARNYAACRVMTQVGLRVNELIRLDLADVRWDLGALGHLHVRYGKGSRGRGPKVRVVPLINGARETLRWYVEDVWGAFGIDPNLPDAPLFPSERRLPGGGIGPAEDDALRAALAAVVQRHLPAWAGRLTPHVLRRYCASQLYLTGMDLLAVQELLGHEWVATTMRYVHVQRDQVATAWLAAQQRAAGRLKGLSP